VLRAKLVAKVRLENETWTSQALKPKVRDLQPQKKAEGLTYQGIAVVVFNAIAVWICHSQLLVILLDSQHCSVRTSTQTILPRELCAFRQ
jgi:hypothetical protein